MLNDFAIGADIVVETTDSLGTTSKTVESGIYPLKIELAYLEKSAGGATALKCIFVEEPYEGYRINQTYWLTSGTAKGGKNYYLDSEGKKKILPGMSAADHLALVATGKHFHELDAQEKVVKLYNFEARSEVPTKVQAVVDLIGCTFRGGVVKKVENKRVQTAPGVWGAGADKREFNEVDKAFTDAGLTVAEMLAGETVPVFKDQWSDKYTGKTINKFDASIAAKNPSVPAGASETKPLFD